MNVLPASFYDQFLSEQALKRRPSPSKLEYAILLRELPNFHSNFQVRSLYPLEKTPDMITLLAGKPNASTFPFTSFSFTARAPTEDPSLLGPAGGSRDTDVQVTIDSDDLATGLQYTDTAGIPGLLNWLGGLQENMHGRKPSGEGWRISVGAGSQDLIFKVRIAFLLRYVRPFN